MLPKEELSIVLDKITSDSEIDGSPCIIFKLVEIKSTMAGIIAGYDDIIANAKSSVLNDVVGLIFDSVPYEYIGESKFQQEENDDVDQVVVLINGACEYTLGSYLTSHSDSTSGYVDPEVFDGQVIKENIMLLVMVDLFYLFYFVNFYYF